MCFVKNPSILIGDRGEKPEKIKQKKGLGLFCLLNGSGGRLSRSITFFC